MLHDFFLFDLDGTLIDSSPGITNSVMHALRKFGIEPPPREKLYKFIGPPLDDSFERFYGFSHEKALKAVEYYREFYSVDGVFQNRVYPGIAELLGSLRDAGARLAIASSKPEVYVRQIAEHFGLAEFFSDMTGSELSGERTDKAEVIACSLKRLGSADRSRVMMIGDREHDIIGAKKNGVDSVGVLYGFGGEEELKGAGATYIAATVEELGALLGK